MLKCICKDGILLFLTLKEKHSNSSPPLKWHLISLAHFKPNSQNIIQILMLKCQKGGHLELMRKAEFSTTVEEEEKSNHPGWALLHKL